MSKVSEFPDESWSEEKILELLENIISGASADQGVRLVCLDELLKRRTIKQVDRVVEVLLEVAEVHGRSKTESPMIIELISRQANLEETAFKKLYDKMVSQNDNLCYCYARIIRKLEDVKKRKCMKRLLWLLMSYNSFSDVTDEMYQTLVTMDNEDINKEIVEATLPYLRGPDTFKVVYAVRITSKLASEFLLEIEPVIERTLKGWYDGQHQVEILENICNYLGRIKDERSVPQLLHILKSDLYSHTTMIDITPKTLASVIDSNPETIASIWEFLEKEKEHHSSILTVFAEMKTSIDLEKLFSVVDIDLSKWRPREALKTTMIKAGEQAKPLLLEMVKEEDQTTYEVAIDCLGEIGVSIEEYSKVFEKPPILQVYEFFYKQRQGMLLENLWKEQDKLGNQLKKKYMKFEYFVQHLFSAMGFVTLFVDPSDKKGVDLVAFSSKKPIILIIGCTTGVLKEDLQRLYATLGEMEEALEELFERHEILPMVITSKKVTVTPADKEYARKCGIAILTYAEITTLLEMLRTNRGRKEIIKQIEQSIPPMRLRNNLYE